MFQIFQEYCTMLYLDHNASKSVRKNSGRQGFFKGYLIGLWVGGMLQYRIQQPITIQGNHCILRREYYTQPQWFFFFEDWLCLERLLFFTRWHWLFSLISFNQFSLFISFWTFTPNFPIARCTDCVGLTLFSMEWYIYVYQYLHRLWGFQTRFHPLDKHVPWNPLTDIRPGI